MQIKYHFRSSFMHTNNWKNIWNIVLPTFSQAMAVLRGMGGVTVDYSRQWGYILSIGLVYK